MGERKIQDGDFYRWSYKANHPRLRDVSPYWCCSRIARVLGGMLVDTYWYGGDNRSWPLADAVEQLDLEFVANVADLDTAPANLSGPRGRVLFESYRREDVVDLSHANGGQVYLRKGAQPCLDVQIAHWEGKRDECQRAADGHARYVEQLRAEKAKREECGACGAREDEHTDEHLRTLCAGFTLDPGNKEEVHGG